VLRLTDGFNRLVLGRSPARRALQAQAIRLLLTFSRTRALLTGRLTGLGIAYPPADRHANPWTGRRMPDVSCDGGRLYELLRDGRFILADTTSTGAAAGAVRGRSRHVHAVRCPTAVPGLPAMVLVRPDAYIAWASDAAADAASAVAQWCGPSSDAEDPQTVKRPRQ
jgi:hypothetical protein